MKGASEYIVEACDKFLNLETGKITDLNYELKK